MHSRDEADMLVYKTVAKCHLKSNSHRTFFAIVLYTNMAAVTSGANQHKQGENFSPCSLWLLSWVEWVEQTELVIGI